MRRSRHRAFSVTPPINLGPRFFESMAEHNDLNVDQRGRLDATHLVHAGAGEITADGMLHGAFQETTMLTWTKGGVAGDPQVTEYEGRMYGAISADWKTLCISRGEDPGAYDIAYIRRYRPGAVLWARYRLRGGVHD